jgi:hypothetical protein
VNSFKRDKRSITFILVIHEKLFVNLILFIASEISKQNSSSDLDYKISVSEGKYEEYRISAISGRIRDTKGTSKTNMMMTLIDNDEHQNSFIHVAEK